jgi:dihydrofolate reductase
MLLAGTSHEPPLSLMQQGLVDEFQIMMNPIVLGNGTPLFKGLRQRADLRPSKTREFKSGNVLLTYTPAIAHTRERSPAANIHAS